MFWKVRHGVTEVIFWEENEYLTILRVCALFGIAFFFVASIPNIPNGAIKEANPNGL